MSLQNRLRRGVHWLCYRSGVSVYRAKRQGFTRVIKFHGVDGHDYRTEILEAQLRYLSKHFSIVSLAAIIKQLREQNRSNSNDIALTFDDGLRNHYTNVYPILKRLNIPATFYVCPGLIESRQWLWNQEARERLQALPPERRAGLCRELRAPSHDIEQVVAWMKRLPAQSRRSAEDAIREATAEFKPDALQLDRYAMMSWKELCSMDPSVVMIGSHTVTHPILTTLSSDDLSYELGESRKWLEEKLKRRVEHFCYPNGFFDEAVLAAVRQYYSSAVSSAAGKVEAGDDLHRLKRINTARQLPLFAWRLHRVGTDAL
jgi:peptidoglycan/xylan/chitin deacetylase (PgdA/CDA1 family)